MFTRSALSVLLVPACLLSLPSPASAQIVRPKVKWAFQTQGPVRGPVTIDGDALYFGSADGHLYAVDKADGRLRWKVPVGGAVAGAPAVSGSIVVVAGRGDTVYGVDATTGAPRWQFGMDPLVPAATAWDYFTASPVITGDQVLIGSGDGHLYSLDLSTGSLRWKFRTGDRIRATPLVVDGTVYQPSGDDFVYALSLQDGSLQWRFATEGTTLTRGVGFMRSDIFTRPTLRNGLLVFGSRDANVYAVDIATHEKRWSFKYDTTWAMATTADDEMVYVGWSTNDMICALDLSSGEKRWEFKAGAHSYTTAAVVGDDTYWGSADGRIYNLDRVTGALRWEYDVGRGVYSSPVHEAGTLYFGADDGRVYALEDGAPAHLAVYRPATIAPAMASLLVDDNIAPYLEQRGFTTLDSTGDLAAFLTARVADRAPSAVVFALGHVPAPVMGSDPSTGLLRRYLESGGKVVWLGGTPNLFSFAEDGTLIGRSADPAVDLLGIKFLPLEDGGHYGATPTQTGLNWGLPALATTVYASLEPDADVIALAYDEYGRVGAWMVRPNARPGAGFVSLRTWGFNTAIRPADLELIDKVARYALE